MLSFPGKKKVPADEGPYLREVHYRPGCQHRAGFTIDEKLDAVECTACGERLNPMWVLQQLARAETRWHNHAAQYQDEMKRLAERSRTKCEHCGQLTRIRRGR
ncbi:hypothetical protein J5T34_05885 [Cupriavidus gilardii]|uniref:hypothetical protein n=1 Tax=Cupriavidus gilardii TaxID=82541 RepID=UPI001ABDE34C|nr:hypothetical protein [Cupriavidus gilardii]